MPHKMVSMCASETVRKNMKCFNLSAGFNDYLILLCARWTCACVSESPLLHIGSDR